MASFYAELHLNGRAYPVRLCHFALHQDTDERGRVVGKVRHGPLGLTLDVPEDDELLTWAAAPFKPLAGKVVFFDLAARVPHETLAFAAGQCVGYHEEFAASNTGAGAYVCQLLVTAPAFTLAAGGPAAPLVAAVRGWAGGGAVSGPTPGLTSTPLPVAGGWLADLETVLGPTAGVRSLVATWVAGGLDEGKLKSALRGAVDQRLVFERLRDAKKGIYQQRVIIDDYANIPGVDKKPCIPNSLPPVAILASAFGVDDPGLDLPIRNAITFTGSAVLQEVKPGEKLYRVTSDPVTDEYAKTGGYWTRTPPTNLGEVIGGTAVMPEWNNVQRVYEFTAPPYADPDKKEPKFYVWEGPAAAQPVSGDYKEKIENGYSLAGGTPQAFVPNKLSRSPDFGSHIQDVTHLHKSW